MGYFVGEGEVSDWRAEPVEVVEKALKENDPKYVPRCAEYVSAIFKRVKADPCSGRVPKRL